MRGFRSMLSLWPPRQQDRFLFWFHLFWGFFFISEWQKGEGDAAVMGRKKCEVAVTVKNKKIKKGKNLVQKSRVLICVSA